jgi:hypothetical protein
MHLTPGGVGALIDAALAGTGVPAHTLIFDTVAPWVRPLKPNFV